LMAATTALALRRSFPHVSPQVAQSAEGAKGQRKYEFMVFGLGHHYFPNSRHSAGIQLVDQLAKYHQIEWKVKENLASFVAEGENFLLIKPRTNGPSNNYKALRACLKEYTEISPEQDLILCHHATNLRLGDYDLTGEYWMKDFGDYRDESLHSITERTRLLDYKRLAIGVSPSDDIKLQPTVANLYNGMTAVRMLKMYLYNKFSQDQIGILQRAIFSDMESVSKKIFSRQNYLRDADDGVDFELNNAVPPPSRPRTQSVLEQSLRKSNDKSRTSNDDDYLAAKLQEGRAKSSSSSTSSSTAKQANVQTAPKESKTVYQNTSSKDDLMYGTKNKLNLDYNRLG